MMPGRLSRRAMAAACACAPLVLGTAEAFANAPAAVAQYESALRNAADQLDSAATSSPARWPAIHVPPAPLPGPPRFSPSLDDWLQLTLGHARVERQQKTRAKELRALSASLRRIADAAAAEPADPRADAAATARAILSQAAYRDESSASAKPQETLWDRFVHWLVDQLDKLFNAISRTAAAAPPFVGKIIATIVGVAFAALLIFLVYRLARAFIARRRRAGTIEEGDLLELLPDPDGLYGLARVAARNGQYDKAIAMLFRAGIMLLDRSGRIPYDAARTAGEYRGEVRDRVRAAAAPFDILARAFTVATYSADPATPNDWNEAEAGFHRFEPLVGPRS